MLADPLAPDAVYLTLYLRFHVVVGAGCASAVVTRQGGHQATHVHSKTGFGDHRFISFSTSDAEELFTTSLRDLHQLDSKTRQANVGHGFLYEQPYSR